MARDRLDANSLVDLRACNHVGTGSWHSRATPRAFLADLDLSRSRWSPGRRIGLRICSTLITALLDRLP
jgi:hypothetical protein